MTMRVRTEVCNKLPKYRLRLIVADNRGVAIDHPKTREECKGGPRPCPLVGCRYNTYLDVARTGNIVYNFPDLEPHEVDPKTSCALDVADEGSTTETLEQVGVVLNVTRERVRQILEKLFLKLKRSKKGRQVLKDLLNGFLSGSGTKAMPLWDRIQSENTASHGANSSGGHGKTRKGRFIAVTKLDRLIERVWDTYAPDFDGFNNRLWVSAKSKQRAEEWADRVWKYLHQGMALTEAITKANRDDHRTRKV